MRILDICGGVYSKISSLTMSIPLCIQNNINNTTYPPDTTFIIIIVILEPRILSSYIY
jgi:hypothetical protein